MKKVLLLLAEGFEFYEASVFIDVMGWNAVEGDRSTVLETCGFSRQVKSAFGQGLTVDHLIPEIDPSMFDALAVPGGFEEFGYYREAYSDLFSGLIRDFHRQTKPIASVCVGALPLGFSGILAGRMATTYNSPARREALGGFGAEVVDEPVVIDGNLITSWNPASAMEVALLLLERLTGTDNSGMIRRLMGF